MRATLQQALEALETLYSNIPYVNIANGGIKAHRAITAIKQALAQSEPIKHDHQWIRTEAMEPGECRCIVCGEWGKTT